MDIRSLSGPSNPVANVRRLLSRAGSKLCTAHLPTTLPMNAGVTRLCMRCKCLMKRMLELFTLDIERIGGLLVYINHELN